MGACFFLIAGSYIIDMAESDVTCTQTTTDTCIITITTDPLQDIICDDSYPNCIVNCDDEKNSCGNTNQNNVIQCPLYGGTCTINCNSVKFISIIHVFICNFYVHYIE